MNEDDKLYIEGLFTQLDADLKKHIDEHFEHQTQGLANLFSKLITNVIDLIKGSKSN